MEYNAFKSWSWKERLERFQSYLKRKILLGTTKEKLKALISKKTPHNKVYIENVNPEMYDKLEEDMAKRADKIEKESKQDQNRPGKEGQNK